MDSAFNVLFYYKTMCKMKMLWLLLISFIVCSHVTGLNEKQMWAAVKMVRNVCQPKTKATQADIDKMHKGDWDIDHAAMCYMWCSLNMYKLMNKDNTLNHESGLQQIKQLPDTYRDPTHVCMDRCKDGAKTLNDKCIAAYELSKCMYFCNPEKYFLP